MGARLGVPCHARAAASADLGAREPASISGQLPPSPSLRPWLRPPRPWPEMWRLWIWATLCGLVFQVARWFFALVHAEAHIASQACAVVVDADFFVLIAFNSCPFFGPRVVAP